jgi:preprotein translocase subunit SecE
MSEKKKSASEMEEPKARTSEREPRKAKASARDERQSRPARRDTKPAAPAKKAGGMRNNAIVSFVREAYRELRYKVTWPTFREARNMAIIVIVLSTVVGLILGLADLGFYHIFLLITGK